MRRPMRLKSWEMAAILALIIVTGLLCLPLASRSREASRRASCQSNLKQMGLVFKMFANESRGQVWPRVSPLPGNWIPDTAVIYPEYVSDLSIMICPSSPFASPGTFRAGRRRGASMLPQCVSSLFYIYTGFTIVRDEEAVALAQTYESQPDAVFASRSLDVTIPVWAETGDPKNNAAAGQSNIPVMWDRVPLYEDEFSHTRPAGGNVLHMDGHVEFVKYSYYNHPNFFPITRISAELFGSTLPRLPGECY
jgi:prepilin-type processing-associated H-X9-DG protein